ncbi:MAG: hypothetical protein H6716_26610 [Polyangiaceae bacterium]|nr:hypothetical protein [Polyangiaceae bacterium]
MAEEGRKGGHRKDEETRGTSVGGTTPSPSAAPGAGRLPGGHSGGGGRRLGVWPADRLRRPEPGAARHRAGRGGRPGAPEGRRRHHRHPPLGRARPTRGVRGLRQLRRGRGRAEELPDGCGQGGNRDDFEPGQGYVEVAAATGGQFGSLCGDMRQNLQDVARVATGVSSTYAVSAKPASATLRVAIGLPGHGRVVPRRRHRRSERIDEHPDRVQRAHGSGRHGSGAWFRSGSS